MDGSLDIEFPPTAPSVGAARRSLDRFAIEEEALRRAKLVVSELTTNVVRHGGAHSPGFRLRGRIAPRTIRLEVCNSVPIEVTLPVPPARGSGGGWGLFIVDRVADRWGIDGSCVWAEIEVGA